MLVGLALALAAPVVVHRPLTASERRVIENAVRKQLSDPDSATFRHNAYKAGGKIYCGLVNSKNRYGGYVGYRLFRMNVVGGKTGAIPAEGDYGQPSIATNDQSSDLSIILQEAREQSCTAQGYQID